MSSIDCVASTPYRPFFESTALIKLDASWTMERANKLRKTIMTKLPTWAIDQGLVLTNTSSMHDDQIVARCCSIPLTAPQSPSTPAHVLTLDGLDSMPTHEKDSDLLVFLLHVQAPPTQHLRVMSGHIQPINHSLAPYEPHISIVKLYPGETVKVLLFARRATGQDHVKHCPAHAFHRRAADGSVELFVRANGAQDACSLVKEALSMMPAQ